MNCPICDSCETVNHCLTHGCIPVQKLKPCRSPYCECTPGTCSHPGCYDARSEQFKHPAPVQEPYTVVRNAWTNKLTYTCNTCGETDFRSEHAARFHICEPPAQPTPATKPTLRVYGWVWKQDRGDGVYEPSYTPAQHVQRGELFALVDPKDLHQPLENTDWFAPQEQITDPCPGCTPGRVCRTPACGRLQLPQSHPLRNKP
jgi:hypothetical protein